MQRTIVLYFVILISVMSCSRDLAKETGFIKAGKLNIYYEREGEGTPVLLLHAGLQDSRMWDHQVNFLKKNHQVITVDLPAQGKSSGFDSTMQMADVLVTVLDSLDIGRTTVIGLSYGSSSATDLVLEHPERIDKVVLVSPGLTGWEKVLQPDTTSARFFALLDSAFSKNDLQQKSEVFTKVWCDGPFRKPEEVEKDVRDYIYATTLSALRDHEKDSWVKFSAVTAAGRIHLLKKPLLIVYGDKDVPFIGEVSRFLNKKVTDSQLIEMPGVAHMLNMEAPDEFNKIISRFID